MYNDDEEQEKGEVARSVTAPQCSTGREHVATIGCNESYCVWQIVVLPREEIESFCSRKDVAFAAGHNEFVPRNRIPALPSSTT
jgi:hypothetical protein